MHSKDQKCVRTTSATLLSSFHTIQSAYDDLVESSREIEDALTQEVADEQKRAANAERRVEELGEQLRASKASAATLKRSLAECEARLGDAEEKAAQSKVERAEMEIMVDEMEEDARRAGANDGAVQAKLERVLEDNVILTTELEVSGACTGGSGDGGGGWWRRQRWWLCGYTSTGTASVAHCHCAH